MKKFKFSLDKLLRQRLIQVDIQKKEFLEAEKLLEQELETLDQMNQQKEDALSRRFNTVSETTFWSASVEQINLFLNGQDLRIKNQNQRLIEFKKRVESRREILQQALTEAKIIEKLKDKKKKEFVKEVLRIEQKETDELSVIRFSKIEN